MLADFTDRIKKRVLRYISLLLVFLYISSWTLPWLHKLTSMHGHPAVCLDSTIESAHVPDEVPCDHDAQHCAICQNYAYNVSWHGGGSIQGAMAPEFQNMPIGWGDVFVAIWQCRQKQPRAPPEKYAVANQSGTC